MRPHSSNRPINSFFLLLHWVRTESSIEQITVGFDIHKQTLYKLIQKRTELAHDDLVNRYMTSQAKSPFPSTEAYPRYGLIVDTTVQDRGRPAGPFEEIREYHSGKHRPDCLKSQVIAKRNELAVQIVAGIPGTKCDFQLFQDNRTNVED